MKSSRLGLWCMALALCMMSVLPVLGKEGGKKDEDKEIRKRPKVNKVYIERARESKSFKPIVELYDGIQLAKNEIATLKAIEDPKEARKAERRIRRLEGQSTRDYRKLEKLIEKKLKPYDKKYREAKRKYDTNKAKAAKMEDSGQADKATRYHQEAAKYSGPMEGAKRQIDILTWFMFFDEEAE